MTTLYHMTTAAEADRIGGGGFQDATTDYGDGVLLAEEPLAWWALGGSPEYDTTVQVLLDIPEDKLAAYAVEEQEAHGPLPASEAKDGASTQDS